MSPFRSYCFLTAATPGAIPQSSVTPTLLLLGALALHCLISCSAYTQCDAFAAA